MSEITPSAIAEEQLIQQLRSRDAMEQEATAVNFSMPEHGSEGHICTAECKHTQLEADQFADNLFSDIKQTSHGEKGHACDANCQHNQVEADKFADSLFSDVKTKAQDHQSREHEAAQHGEKGHICTAECKHTQLEADQFADNLFSDIKQTSHGEKGHVCDANCQHNQVEADKFADSLFSNNVQQEQSVKNKLIENPIVRETQEANRIAEPVKTELDRVTMYEQQYRSQQAQLVEIVLNEQSSSDEQSTSTQIKLPTPAENNLIKHASGTEMIEQTRQRYQPTILPQTELNQQRVEEFHAKTISDEQDVSIIEETATELPKHETSAVEVLATDSVFPESTVTVETNNLDVLDVLNFQIDEESLPDTESIEENGYFKLSTPESSMVMPTEESNVELENVIDSDELTNLYLGTDEVLLSEIVNLEGYDQFELPGPSTPLSEATDNGDLVHTEIIGDGELDNLNIGAEENPLHESSSLNEYDDLEPEESDQPVKLVYGMVMAIRSNIETKPENELVNEEILEDLPEFSHIKQILPTLIEALENYTVTVAKEKLEQVTQTIDEILGQFETGLELKEMAKPDKALIHEKLESIVNVLGLKAEQLEIDLQMTDEESPISFLTIEILKGLKKFISAEHSLEFTQISSAQDDAKNSSFIRELGKLLLNVLSYSNRPTLRLASS